MKPRLLSETVVAAVVLSTLVWGCAKPSDKYKLKSIESQETALPADLEKAQTQMSTDKVCSPAILQIYQDLKKSQFEQSRVSEKGQAAVTKEAKRETDLESIKIAEKQLELCEKIILQFKNEKVDSCFKSESKALDNVLAKQKVTNQCSELEAWYQKTKGPNSETSDKTSLVASRLIFSNDAIQLFETKEKSKQVYLSEGQIRTGQAQLEQDLKDGKSVCLFSTNSDAKTESLAFKVASENDNAQGTLVLSLQDEKQNLSSVECRPVDSKKNKLAALKEIFGEHISIQQSQPATEVKKEDVRKSQVYLNENMAPAAPAPTKIAAKADDAVSATEGAQPPVTTTKQNPEKMIDQAVEKAKETINSFVKDTLAEVQKTALTIKTETIQESKTAAIEVIQQGEKSSAAVIDKGREAVKDVIDHGKEAAKEVTDHGKVAAKEVADHAIAKAAVEGKKVADQVVDTAIDKGKKAASDLIPHPIDSATNWVKGLFSSDKKETAKQDSKADVKKKDETKKAEPAPQEADLIIQGNTGLPL